MQFPPRRFWPRLAVCLFALSPSLFPALLLLPAEAEAFWPFAPEQQQVARRQGDASPSPDPARAGQVQEAAALHGELKIMADTLFRNLADPDPENGDLADGIFVCTFVDLKKMYRTSSLGRYVAEQLMSEMQQRRYTVLELRKSRAVMVQEKRGEYGLSRDPDELGDSVAAGAMLTGTYVQSKDSVIINARIIDNRSARLLAAATAIIPRNQLAEQLLADSATAKTKTAEPMYLKRLEL
ncbi:FlgO family outer membrane protein [Thiovibrio sp. JS02]